MWNFRFLTVYFGVLTHIKVYSLGIFYFKPMLIDIPGKLLPGNEIYAGVSILV